MSEKMYTLVLYPDRTWEVRKNLVTVKATYPDKCRFFGIPPGTTVKALEEWIALDFPAGELIEY